jgi:hypothetical protein
MDMCRVILAISVHPPNDKCNACTYLAVHVHKFHMHVQHVIPKFVTASITFHAPLASETAMLYQLGLPGGCHMAQPLVRSCYCSVTRPTYRAFSQSYIMGVHTPRPVMYDLHQDNSSTFQSFIHCLEDPSPHPSELINILDRFTLETER